MKKNLENGIDVLLSPTTSIKKKDKEEKCVNFHISPELHTKLKIASIEKGMKLKELIAQIIEKYLKEEEK